MDFTLSQEQHERHAKIQAAAGAVAGHRPEPAGHFRREDWDRAAAIGLTGLCLPRAAGGLGLDALDTAFCLEAFSRGCPDTGLVFAVAAHLLACAVPIRDFGGSQSAALLAGLARGELIAANAMTEDAAGSDTGALRTVARRVGENYELTGEKSFASNAPMADLLVTYAVTDPRAGFLGITAFAVPRELPGVEISGPMRKMGLDGCPAGRIRFSGCEVPARYVIGDEGQGSAIFQHSMGWERACLPAIYLGVMEEQLRMCVEHASRRRQFGRRLADNQAVSHRLATMKQRAESGRLLLYRACWLLDESERDPEVPGVKTAAALAKIAVSEAVVANGLDAIQIFGGAGYLADTGVERQLRDAVPSQIFSGTTDIQREIVAREMGL
jgi:clorobiocin biosynthesis protein CloN3